MALKNDYNDDNTYIMNTNNTFQCFMPETKHLQTTMLCCCMVLLCGIDRRIPDLITT